MKRKICFIALLLSFACLFASCNLFETEPDNAPEHENEGNHEHLPDNKDEGNHDNLPDDENESLHEHNYGEWVTVSAPTCTEEGLRERTCLCSDKESETVAPLEHDEYTYSEKDEDCHIINVTACNRCDYIVKTDSGDESHSYGEWELSDNTTDICECEWKPVYVRTCSDCSNEESKTENAPGHSCDPTELNIHTDPTMTTAGILSAPCKKCDCCEANIEIPPFNDTDYLAYVIDSTCNEHGEGLYYYNYEGMTFSWTVDLPLAPHDYENLICKLCGSVAPAGLYNDDGNLIASWSELVNVYRMNVEADYNLGNYAVAEGHPTYVLANENLSQGTKLVIDESVTYIGVYAFEKCSTLTFVMIPDSVTSIGSYAFNYCESLVSVDISDSITAINLCTFSGCKALTTVTIPDSVTNIGNGAFYYCQSLTSISIPDGVTDIGAMAFMNCSVLTSVVLPSSVKDISASAFSLCTEITDVYFVGTADEWAALSISDSNEYLTDARIHYFSGTRPTTDGNFWRYENGVITPWPKEDSKEYSEGLKYVAINGLTCYVSGIGNCTDTDIIIPATSPDGRTVIKISANAFMNCTSIVSILIPNTVTEIGEFAFYGCTSLLYVDLPDELTSLSAHTFYGCKSLVGVKLSSELTSIGESAFDGCSSLAKIELTYKITEIGKAAFANCKALKKITLPIGITSIAERTFHNCRSLTSVVIPSEVRTIGEGAFLNCGSLTSVNFLGTEQRWNRITIGDRNTDLTNTTIEYITEEEYI